MDENQASSSQPPPPYTAYAGYAPPGQPAYPPQGQPGYPPQGQTGYPPPGQPGYPPPGQPGYPPQGKAGYQSQGYPPQGYGYPQVAAPPVSTFTNNVTVVQTGGPVIAQVQSYPPDNCGMAWFACLFCFWPLGLCAIISSNNARDAINRGDIASANYSSMMARKYANLSIVIGVCMMIMIIILITVT